jgi:4-oxalocrotonate tautomerase
MPYVNIKVTREGGPNGTGPSVEQKKELIAGVTDLLVRVLDKDPATTFVIIDEVDLDNWGLNSMSTRDYRARQSG